MSLQIKKLDLHVHTPASHDFNKKSIDLEKIIEKAINAGLDGIAITDHNSVATIDILSKESKKRNFTIFPGFEISCHGAKEGSIHVIGIYDPSKTQVELERILGKLDIKGEGENSLTSKGVEEVVNIIRETDGLAILAHANSSHGALNDIRGNPRICLVQNKNLCAAETTESDFKKPIGERLIDLLNGNDKHYKRKLAVYCSSDNPNTKLGGHSIDTIGNQFTYFKMGQLTIESLRQCFEDPDTRIIQSFETDKIKNQQPRIANVSITNGFLNNQEIDFHPGMNSIIGGTGTGKSLLIEFIRFVFDKPPHKDLLNEYRSKIEKQLRNKGTVKIIFIDYTGDEYEISRTLNVRKFEESLISCKNLTTGDDYTGEINSIFPILFYSQNEILEVTRDKKAQMDLLDNFRDFESYKHHIIEIETRLHDQDRKYVSNYEVAVGLPDLLKQEQTCKERIKKLEKKLKLKVSKEFEEFDKLDNLRNISMERTDIFQTFSEILNQAKTDLEKEGKSMNKNVTSLESPEKEVIELINETYPKLVIAINAAMKIVKIGNKKADQVISNWEKENKYSSIKAIYEKSIKQRTKLELLETERQKIIGERDKIKKNISKAEHAKLMILQLRKSRLDLLKRLQNIRNDYYIERESQAKLITERSTEKLKIQIHRQGDNQRYKENLLKLKVKSYAEEKEIDSIVEKLSVLEFVEAVLDNDKDKIAKTTNISLGKVANIISILLSSDNLQKTLSLQYDSFPEDQIDILYRKQDASYHPLIELSMGQKADALLMIALGDSAMPVIIDQPEDALDLSSIWDDICQRLRTSKHARQFIFTTHNSSVAVASDSDQYVVMEADATSGWVSTVGSIDEDGIKTKVIDHLEGGRASYTLKGKKYNIKADRN